MTTRKQKQTTAYLKPKNGQNEATVTVDLNGYVESMVVYTRGTENILQPLEDTKPLIFMSVQDNNFGDIIPMVHIDNYKQTGGSYKASLKPLGFMAKNETFSLNLQTERTSNGNKENDIEVFVHFFYGQEPKKSLIAPVRSQNLNPQPVKPIATNPRR